MADDIIDVEEPVEFGCQNLTLLSDVNDKAIVDNLKLRFERNKVYTFTGDVIISVNPYQSITEADNEDDSIVTKYCEREVFDRPPHVFGAVDLAYLDMKQNNVDTCIIFSGVCGSGKTEAAKMAMCYITHLTEEGSRDEKVQNLLVNSNIVLESFGNAKTLWNNNSSRFGKYVQVTFDFKHVPVGGHVSTCILETSRVVSRRQGERNFHHFYQLLAGASDSVLSDLELERDLSHYHYLEETDQRDQDDRGSLVVKATDDKDSFQTVNKAMELLHFTEGDQSDIRKILGAILHLGNIRFEDHCHDHDKGDTNLIEKVARLLGTSQHDILTYLTRVGTSQNGETIKVEQFETFRDELAMFLYSVLFDYVVGLINRAVSLDEGSSECRNTSSMYLVDYPGFGAYSDSNNNFYQFCTNYCNERLHQVFVNKMLKQRQEEYTCERLQWTHVDFVDNETVCRMIDDEDKGMFTIMMDGVQGLKTNPEEVIVAMDQEFGGHEHYSSSLCGKNSLTNGQFQIRHSYKEVTYDLATFSAPQFKRVRDIRKLLSTCQLSLLKKLFSEPITMSEGTPTANLSTTSAESTTVTLRHSICSPLEQIAKKRCHYVCCLMPNVHKSPTEFDREFILNQVCAHGLVEHTKIHQSGFYSSMSYSSFVSRYKLLFTDLEDVECDTDKEMARELIKAYNFEPKVAFGKSKIFLQTAKTVSFLEGLRESKKPDVIAVVVNWYRRCRAQTWLKQVLNVFENCSDETDYGMELQWPRPPVVLNNAYCLLREVQRKLWALKKVKELSDSEKEIVRLKTIALTLLEGKKFNWLHSDKWRGDELGLEQFNPRSSEYKEKMKTHQAKNGDKGRRLIFSCLVTKLNRKMKPDPRICVLSECCLYRLDTNFYAKKRHCIDIGHIVGLSISPGNDQALVIHCEPKVGDIVFYMENDRPASELLAAIWWCYQSNYNKPLPVHVTAEIQYSRPGVRNGRLMCDPGSSLKRKCQ